MINFKMVFTGSALLALSACGGGGSTKPDPAPSTTCSQRLGTGSFVTSTVNNPSVTDATCPSGSTLSTSGISYTTTTTTYACPDPNSNSNPVASTSTSTPIVTQTKVCTVTPTITCAQKLGTGTFIDSSQVSTSTDSTCPVGQSIVQNGLSQITTTTTYRCVDSASTADPVATITSGASQLTQPKVCNISAPINYSTYFRDKTGVTQANAAGFDGRGVKIAIYDNGFNVNNAAFSGRVSTTFGDLTDDDPDNTSHGTSVAAIAAGQAWGDFPGGVAPASTLALADWNSNLYSIINWGAKVFNFSFGYGYDEDTPADSAPDANDATASDISRYVAPWVDEMRAIRDAGAFLVISAGNDGEQAAYDSAGILAAAPAFYTDLNNVVAVVAMSPLNGTKAGYSNPCGAIAMNFCLAAPGTVNLLLPTVTTSDPLTADSYKWFAGTSAATPVVSGIAALVYQAFPGFTGNQVRQTLLTTATDLGALGVDPVYGWGYVNAQKAVLGPALLSTSFSAAVPSGATWIFGNDISGDGELIKIGGGGLSLTGNNTFVGSTTIESGTLNLYGNLGSDVLLNGGTFNTFGGKLGGDVHATAGTLGLAADSELQVAGNLYLMGADMQILAPTGYTSQWQGTVLSAASISGEANLQSNSAWFSGTATIQDARIQASILRKAVTDVLSNYSATQQNSAHNLETAFAQLDKGLGNNALRQSAAALQSTNTEQASTALLALSGQSQTTMKDLALETSDALQPLLNERLRDIDRINGERGGLWFMTASPGARKSDHGFLDADINSTLWAAGADWRWQQTSIGAAVFTADDRVEYQGVEDQVRGDRRGFVLYARQQGLVWYWQGYAQYSQFDSRVTRGINNGEAISLAESRSEGDSSGVSVELGRKFKNHFGIALLASADWVALDAYEESGSTGLELGFESARFSRVLLGPDARYGRELASGFSWDAQLGYRFVLNDVDTGMRAYYTGLTGTGFTVDGMPYPDGFLSWGLGLGYRHNNAHWYLRGNGQDSGNANRFTLSAGVRIGF